MPLHFLFAPFHQSRGHVQSRRYSRCWKRVPACAYLAAVASRAVPRGVPFLQAISMHWSLAGAWKYKVQFGRRRHVVKADAAVVVGGIVLARQERCLAVLGEAGHVFPMVDPPNRGHAVQVAERAVQYVGRDPRATFHGPPLVVGGALVKITQGSSGLQVFVPRRQMPQKRQEARVFSLQHLELLVGAGALDGQDQKGRAPSHARPVDAAQGHRLSNLAVGQQVLHVPVPTKEHPWHEGLDVRDHVRAERRECALRVGDGAQFQQSRPQATEDSFAPSKDHSRVQLLALVDERDEAAKFPGPVGGVFDGLCLVKLQEKPSHGV